MTIYLVLDTVVRYCFTCQWSATLIQVSFILIRKIVVFVQLFMFEVHSLVLLTSLNGLILGKGFLRFEITYDLTAFFFNTVLLGYLTNLSPTDKSLS